MQPQQQQMSNGAPQMQQQQFAAFYPQMFAQQGYSFGNNNNSINNNNDNNNMQAMFYMQAGQPSMQIMQQNGGSAVNNNNQQQSLVNTLSRDNNSSSNNASQPSNNNQQQMQQQQPQNSLAQQFQQIFSKQNNNNNTTGSMPTTKSENRTSSTDSMQSSERDRSISSAVSTHSNSQRSQYGVSNDASSTSSTTSVLQQVSQQMQQQQQQMNSMQQQPNFANVSGSYTIPPGYTLVQAPNGQTVLVPTGPQQYQSYFQPNSNSFSQMQQQQQQQQQGGPSMVSNIDPQNQNTSQFFPSGFMTQNGPIDGANSFDMRKVQLSAPASANLNAKGVSSKYRGVSWHRRDKAWTARIWNNGKSEHLGTFTTELRAALAVDIKAAAYFGDTFAEFNFPCEDERRRLIWVFMQPDIKPSSRLLEIMADPNVAVKYLAKGSSRRKNRKRLAAAMASNNSSKGDNESGSSVSSQTTGSSKVKNSKARRRDECEPHIIGLDKLRPHQHQRQAEGASDSSDSRFDSNGSNDILSKSSALRSSPSDTRKNFLRNPGQIQSGSCSSGSASSLSNEGDSGIPSSTSSGGKH
eukprot:CAMPEP_0171490906 /NCGR_PEP_ID=MMETSP0958-20121227/3568_1 /TAXON_ID=87120 /ORGANISM="Aurantiochytrium limacinum, Strain ATCCMYA-1381" /LENGTH=576 /DNA_ID=CAMNT_0012024273 /DNA_START=611 /DNA_END=2341 /DNA_ORIENTATION=-